MPEKKKNEDSNPVEEFFDDVIENVSTVFGLLSGEVDDGPTKPKEKPRGRIDDSDDGSDDGNDDDVDDEPAPKKKGTAARKQDPVEIVFRAVQPRGPGRPSGPAPKKKPEPGAEGGKAE